MSKALARAELMKTLEPRMAAPRLPACEITRLVPKKTDGDQVDL